MKKYLSVFIVFAFFYSTQSSALDGEGTVEEIRMCTYSDMPSPHENFMFFKLSDGNWFALYGHFVDGNRYGGGDTPSQSLVLLAYSNLHKLKVRANFRTFTECGVTASAIWHGGGDYIILNRN